MWQAHLFLMMSVLVFFIACNNTDEQQNDIKTDSLTIELISKKIRNNPFDAKLFADRAQIYWNLHKRDSAINDAIIAVKLDSTSENLTLMLAEYLLRTAKSDTAITILNNFLMRKPESVKVLTRIAKYYSYVKDYKKAKENLDKALTIDNQYADAHFVKGMVLYETQQYKEAIKAFQDAVQFNPEDSEAYMMLGLIHQERNDSIAIQYYKSAAQLKGKDPQPYYNMAYFYQENKQYAKAIDIYNYILRVIDKKYSDAYFNQGYIYMVYLKNYDRAILYYDSVLMLQPNRVEAICNKAYCFEQIGDKISAKSLYIKAKAIVPNYDLAIEGLNRLDKK